MEDPTGYEEIIKTARNAFNSGKTRSLEWRLTQLKNLQRLLIENTDAILDVLQQDLKKSQMEAQLYELDTLGNELVKMMKDLNKLAACETLPANLLAALDSGKVIRQPLGVVLIIGPWNYPFLLSLQPVIGAIAAGNSIVLKPSEVAPQSAALMAKLISQYMDNECYHVVQAGIEGTKDLLKNKFDHIFYTGSTPVGKAIMAAAAPNLTPMTLELGGKSPCYIDDSSDIEIAAKRILWGKVLNLGQTCIAPDYILCSREVENTFVKVANQVLKEWYGTDIQKSPDIPRIINEKHCNRIQQLLHKTQGNVVVGGKIDVKDLWVEPTIVVNIKEDDPLMQDEIFAPILPIMRVNSAVEAINFINSRPRPLALYIFSKKEKVTDKIIAETISGGVCVNDVLWQAAWNGLPFGGVGDSGFGNYHGKYTFDTFSHQRAILNRSLSVWSEKLGEARYPPYTARKLKYFQMILSYFTTFNMDTGKILSFLFAVTIGFLIGVLVFCVL